MRGLADFLTNKNVLDWFDKEKKRERRHKKEEFRKKYSWEREKIHSMLKQLCTFVNNDNKEKKAKYKVIKRKQEMYKKLEEEWTKRRKCCLYNHSKPGRVQVNMPFRGSCSSPLL